MIYSCEWPTDAELRAFACLRSGVNGPLRVATAIVVASFLATLVTMSGADAASRSKPNQIRYEYIRPKDPKYQTIYRQMKDGHALEHLQQLLSPLRLPRPLTLKVSSCDGVPDAWYSDKVVTVCYELLEELLRNATQDLPAEISKADAVLGPALDIFLHETGHAVFEMLKIPVLGRQEDAADQFSAYVMLRLSRGEARRLILGATYHYAAQVPEREVTVPRHSFSDEHSTPAQRAYNVLCIAYGADKKLFSDVVKDGMLPKRRAEICEMEYDDLAFAMTMLIGPHIDKRIARKFRQVWTRTVGGRRARVSRSTR